MVDDEGGVARDDCSRLLDWAGTDEDRDDRFEEEDVRMGGVEVWGKDAGEVSASGRKEI